MTRNGHQNHNGKEHFKEILLLCQEYDHEYSSASNKHDWFSSKEVHIHKNCRRYFISKITERNI